jgi:hypothetical protein
MSNADHVEIHAPSGDEICFGPGTGWVVPSGYSFEFRMDGNLHILNPAGEGVWSSETGGSGATRLCFQDGALRLYSPDEREPVWSTDTGGHPGAFLMFQNDGNLVVYAADREALWATGTNGK